MGVYVKWPNHAETLDRLAQTTFDESEQLEARIKQRRAELQQLQATEVSTADHVITGTGTKLN